MSPSPFVVEWVGRLGREWNVAPRPAEAHSDSTERRQALDVAAGRGRHAIAIARAGFHTFAVDLKLDALRDATAAAAAAGVHVNVS